MNLGFEIKRLSQQDVDAFYKLIKLFHEVFETKVTSEVDEAYLTGLLEKPSFVVFAAIIDSQIVGGLTGYELPMYYTEGSEMFIYDIAIKPAFQRKGLGKQLLAILKEYCLENGINTMFVQAHEADAEAVEFYHSTGGQGEKVIQFSYGLEKDKE